MTYQTIQQKKSFISLRYRTYSNSQNEYDVNNILLEKVNIPQLDEECEKINNSIINVRRVQYELCLTYQQFTQCSLYENNEEKLSQAIVHLKSDLGEFNWKLERSHRYKMKINLYTDFTENSTHCNVELFNRINEMCSDLIKSSDNLPNQLLSYIKNLLKYKSYFLSAVQFRFIQPINLQIDDSLKDESIINDQIDKIRTYRTNVNNSRIILNEIERLNQIVKCLFKNLIKSTANYLVSSNS
ncbi:hypothetical protein KSF78_0005966 [Schistosoma japonicum]|nr:hypothetical protein KSF78_0005966 [Schistosoma japonicum]KAH8870594.1 hypothetical protein KSF78_0005966 [Schistosoma japonicum]